MCVSAEVFSYDISKILRTTAKLILEKNVFLKILYNSQENTCVSLFFNKVAEAVHKFIKKDSRVSS